MSSPEVLNLIKEKAKQLMPEGSHLYLYGSHARGDFRDDSDWDLLLLLNKQHDFSDFDNFSYPLISLGAEMGISVSAQSYTQAEWNKMSFSPFYHNIEQDKIVLL